MTPDERIAAVEGRLAAAEARVAALEASLKPAVPTDDPDEIPASLASAILRESRGLSPESARAMNRAVRLRYAMAGGTPDERADQAIAYVTSGEAEAVRTLVDFS